MENLQRSMKRDNIRRKRAYNPEKLGMGGKELLEAMENHLKAHDYDTWKQYLVRAREIIKWYEAYFTLEDESPFYMDSMLYAMEANVVPPGIEDMLSDIADKKKHKHLINSYKVMMTVSE